MTRTNTGESQSQIAFGDTVRLWKPLVVSAGRCHPRGSTAAAMLSLVYAVISHMEARASSRVHVLRDALTHERYRVQT